MRWTHTPPPEGDVEALSRQAEVSRALAELLLRAGREGMLDLRWEVICPLCHGAAEQTDALDRLTPGTVHCDSCMVYFEAELERARQLAAEQADRVAICEEIARLSGPDTVDRVAELKAGVTRQESDVQAIKRELAKLPSAKTN